MKKKNAVALFEAISKSKQKEQAREGYAAPGWFTKQPSANTSAASQETPETASPPPQDAIAGPKSSYGRGRIVLSFTSVGVAAGIVVIAALLAGAFAVGRMTAPKGPAVLAGTGQGGLPAARLNGETPARILGKWYLVIQAVSPAKREDAQKIVQWLKTEKNEPCNLETIGEYTCVWSLTPMDSRSSTEAVAYAKKIESLGQEYKKKFVLYDFSQHYQGKLDPMYKPFKGSEASKS